MGAGTGLSHVKNLSLITVIIPPDTLSAPTLQAVIEDWLSRQAQESVLDMAAHQHTVEQVRNALQQGQLVLTWDDESQSINILDREQLQSLL